MIKRIVSLFAITFSLYYLPTYAQDLRGAGVKSKTDSQARTALIIGNGSYTDAPLKNPLNDATDMAAALKTLGFEVLSYTNLDQNGMKKAIRDFGAKLRTKGGVGLFYYAGHGVQVKGANYLIPVSAQVNTEEEVEYESVEVGLVLAQMESANNNMNIVILDACRNNPFARSFRSADKGLASIDAPSGTLIAYSTAPGSVASDGTGRNGIYTHELLKNIQTSDLTIEDVFKRVRSEVRQITQGKQTPWESSSLINDFYFASTGKRKPLPAEDTPNQTSNNEISTTNNNSHIVKESFFTFELHKCVKSGTMVNCDLTITNNDSIDKNLGFGFVSKGRAYDEGGNESKRDGWQIANKSLDRAKLLPDVPTKAKVSFKNVSEQAKVLKRIELDLIKAFYEGSSFKVVEFRVQFQEVPLQ